MKVISKKHILSQLILVVCLTVLSKLVPSVAGQLTSEQEAELGPNETLFNEFLKGFRMEEINSEFYSCLWEQNQLMQEYNITTAALNQTDETLAAEMFPSWEDRVFNVTQLISDEVSLTWYNCVKAVYDTYIYVDEFTKGYEDRTQYYSYPVSVLQTALANLVYITQLNLSIQEASLEDDDLTFYFLVGRLMRVVLVVDPLPIEQLEDEITDSQFDQTSTRISGHGQSQLSAAEETTRSQRKSRFSLKQSPDYIPAEQMNIGYIIVFLIEGFGSQTIGFSSTYAATRCGDIGWSIFNTLAVDTVSQIQNAEYSQVIDSTTLALREIDSLAKLCIETGYEYWGGLVNYGTAVTDPTYLSMNLLYHTETIYESVDDIVTKVQTGFEGNDSAYYEKLGHEIGEIFYWVFYDVGDFAYPDIEIYYPTDFDDEGLDFFD